MATTRNIQEMNMVVQVTTQGVSTMNDLSRTMERESKVLVGAISDFQDGFRTCADTGPYGTLA